ncbi:MAG: hypothetical protein AB9836_06140 [Aminipila sp.]
MKTDPAEVVKIYAATPVKIMQLAHLRINALYQGVTIQNVRCPSKMVRCHICGDSESNEWRHCPKIGNHLVCGSEHCIVCEHWRKEEDKGTLWCTYWHGNKDAEGDRKNKIADLERQLIIKDQEIQRLYKQNKPKKAELKLRELRQLQVKIKELKRA